MTKSYKLKRIELHEKSLALFRKAAEIHLRLLEIEDQAGDELPDEHFDLTMELAHMMRDQVEISFEADELEENEEASKGELN